MIVLGIDPSSTRTGWSVCTSAHDVVVYGVLRPRKDAGEGLRGQDVGEQILDVLRRLRDADGIDPDVAYVEMPGRPMAGRLKQRSRDLGTYAFAAGQIAGVVSTQIPVRCVRPEIWTQGASKDRRREICRTSVPGYGKIADAGGDVSDAICISRYGLRVEETDAAEIRG